MAEVAPKRRHQLLVMDQVVLWLQQQLMLHALAPVVHALYNEDVLPEETILQWAEAAPA